jgi:hypothetical protein
MAPENFQNSKCGPPKILIGYPHYIELRIENIKNRR